MRTILASIFSGLGHVGRWVQSDNAYISKNGESIVRYRQQHVEQCLQARAMLPYRIGTELQVSPPSDCQDG
jgi:hypothetical protein